MNEQEPIQFVKSRPDPESYVRINITKGAKGEYRHETTVSMKWEGSIDDLASAQINTLLHRADDLARKEITRREAEDRGE